jgi:hypothetical protein
VESREQGNQNPGLDQPGTYQIKVQGRLDARWSDWFEGMTITIQQEGDGPPMTTLTGVVVDQAALQGMLRALYTLGLRVLAVKCVDSPTMTGSDPERKH